MTVVTIVTLAQGNEAEWDEAMRERLDAVKDQAGWISGQLAMPVDRLDQRTIIGTWETRAHWEAWHDEAAFLQTRERLEGLQSSPSQTRWYEVISTPLL